MKIGISDFLGRTRDKTPELIARADAFRDRRQWDEAIRAYAAVLEADPRLAHIWVQYGHALKESGRLPDAEAAYRKAQTMKDDGDIRLQLGHLHKVMGNPREAESEYLRALEVEPGNADAREELARMGWSSKKLRERLFPAEAEAKAPGAFVGFELSDLVDHLQRNPHPTGIQRVQLELAAALGRTAREDRLQFLYYDHLRSDFFEIPARLVSDIVAMAGCGAGQQAGQALRRRIDLFKGDVAALQPFEFPANGYLVNVGTSWGFLNYFLTIRELKRRSAIRFVPLVHDCIPILFPEFCNPDLVRDFINWITLMMGHADLVLVNSANTGKDVQKVAQETGEALPPVRAIRLDGEYRGRDGEAASGADAANLLALHNLDAGNFVLFVSTIEPRKNHMLALNAWSRMLKSRPRGRVPRLVCVGNSGWMNDDFARRLESDPVLRERVVVLRNVPDRALDLLYRACMFTLFPSLYEGWGLPISEALAFGKVPLVSRVSSHPEAGGELAVYFDPNSEADFQTKLEFLIDHAGERDKLEKRIQEARPLRPWAAVGAEILEIVDGHFAQNPPRAVPETQGAPQIATGRYCRMARNGASSLQDLTHAGDIYRAGVNWHGPEPWGCWVRGLTADIAFSLAPEEGDDFLLYLHWCGSANLGNAVTLSLPAADWSKRHEVAQGQERWDIIPFRFRPGSGRDVRLRIVAERIDDFSAVSEGRDSRLASVGVKGIYVCRASDAAQRLAIMEAVRFGNFDAVARRFPQVAAL